MNIKTYNWDSLYIEIKVYADNRCTTKCHECCQVPKYINQSWRFFYPDYSLEITYH